MPTTDRREADPSADIRAACQFELSELRELYGEDGLRTLLMVAFDEFECQRLALDTALARGQWDPAAQALHRLTGTAAFFVRDERMLEPLGCAERALRLADPSLTARAITRARSVLSALGTAFVDALGRPSGRR